MLIGRVTPRLQAFIALRVEGPSGPSDMVDAVVDTGFNGSLTLPTRIIEALGLQFKAMGTARLADGTLVTPRKFAARVLWLGAARDIYVLETGSIPLVGMSLLQGCELRVVVEASGEVRISALDGSG